MAHKMFVASGTVEVSSVLDLTAGDSLLPLRRLKSKYLAKAAYVGMLGHDTTHLLTAARAVGDLISPPPVALQFTNLEVTLAENEQADAHREFINAVVAQETLVISAMVTHVDESLQALAAGTETAKELGNALTTTSEVVDANPGS